MTESEDQNPLEAAKVNLQLLTAARSVEIYVPCEKVNSNTVFKIISLKESLLWRGVELGCSACVLYDSKQHIPAFVLTRASLENTALVYRLLQEVRKFQKEPTKDVEGFLEREAFGSNNPKSEIESINILTLVDQLNKLVPGFRGAYDALSDFVHPNFTGVIGTYGRPGDPKRTFRARGSDVTSQEIGSRVLLVSLNMQVEFDKECREITDKLL